MTRAPNISSQLTDQFGSLPPDVQEDVQAAMDFMALRKSVNTRAAYQSDWGQFKAFCIAKGLTAWPAPPGVVATYLGWMARWTDEDDPVEPNRAPYHSSTITRRLAAINELHKEHSPQNTPPGEHQHVRHTLEGIRRDLGIAANAKAPLLTDDIRRMARVCDTDTAIGLRDRALILLGFSGAFRASELHGLDSKNLQHPSGAPGFLVQLSRSKSDQKARGRAVSVLKQDPEICPVRALVDWMTHAGIGRKDINGQLDNGPLFRSIQKNGTIPRHIRYRPRKDKEVQVKDNRLSVQSIINIVKKYAVQIGYDADSIGAHSLRAGYVTSALLGGVDPQRIQEVTGHKQIETLMGYYRYSGNWKDHPSKHII